MAKRERPLNGGMVWHARANTFECEGCGELMAQGRRVWTNPEQLAMVRELLILDHTECWEYDDPRMAKLQRRFRKDVKRQKLLMGRRGNDRMGTVEAVDRMGSGISKAGTAGAEGGRGPGV